MPKSTACPTVEVDDGQGGKKWINADEAEAQPKTELKRKAREPKK